MGKKPADFRNLEPVENPVPAGDGSRGSFRELAVGAGSSAFHMDRNGFWLGAKAFADALFSVTMGGAIKAVSGYFGSLANGIILDSNGLTLTGTGFIRTAASGTRFVMTSTSFQGINATGDVIFEVELDGAAAGDVTIGDVISGQYSQWDDSLGEFVVYGVVRALSGYFGSLLNGVLVDSTGLTLTGDGYVRTGSSGERIVMEAANATAFHSLLFYDSGNTQKMRLSPNGIYQNRASGDGNDGVQIDGAGTGDFFSAIVSGTDSREADAAYRFDNSASHGMGMFMKNTNNSWDGNFIEMDPDGTSKNNLALRIHGQSTSAVSYESKLTADGALAFPAYRHRSEFDETPAALASTIIAKAFWTGGGTAGTQEIATEGSEFSDDEYTYLKLSTTSTASRTSTATFNRSTRCATSRSRLEAMISVNSKTNTRWEWGWRLDANNYAVFVFDSDDSGTAIYFETNVAGTVVTTQIATSGNVDEFARFTIQMYNGQIYCWINDVLEHTITNGFSFFGVMKPYAYIDNKAAAEEKILRIDYVDIAHGRPLAP